MSPVRAFIFPESQCGGSFNEAAVLVKDMMEKYKDYEPEEEEESNPENEGKEE